MKLLSKSLLSVLVIGALQPVTASTNLMDILDEYQAHHKPETSESSNQIQTEPKTEELISQWVLPNSTTNEKKVMKALQSRGIEDKNALATVMGNIKQESKFHSNICEGGARVSYHNCYTGGYGLIQWTTVGRYDGLGAHAYSKGMDPSTAEAQISYLFTERQWKSVEPYFMKPGGSIGHYMSKAYYWLGWGHHGDRTSYSYDYARRMVKVSLPK